MNTSQTADSKPSALQTLVAIVIEPSKAFRDIQSRSMIVFPLLLVILATVLLWVVYYQMVDFSWLQDKMTASIPEAAVREKAKEFMTRNFLLISTLIGVVLVTPGVYATVAVYFMIVSKIKGIAIGFEKWFAFTAWVSVPNLLIVPLGIMQIMLSDGGKISIGQLNPVSLNTMFFHLDDQARWAGLLNSVSLITVWTCVLSVIGFQLWSKLSRTTSIVIVLLPYVVIYGIWAAVSFLIKTP